MNRVLCLLFVALLFGCGFTKDTSKGIGGEIGSSFKKADDKEELLNSREKVKKSKIKYNKCLKDNPGSCDSEKAEYDQNVDEFVELQKKLNEL